MEIFAGRANQSRCAVLGEEASIPALSEREDIEVVRIRAIRATITTSPRKALECGHLPNWSCVRAKIV
jgi:hypothetical protein